MTDLCEVYLRRAYGAPAKGTGKVWLAIIAAAVISIVAIMAF